MHDRSGCLNAGREQTRRQGEIKLKEVSQRLLTLQMRPLLTVCMERPVPAEDLRHWESTSEITLLIVFSPFLQLPLLPFTSAPRSSGSSCRHRIPSRQKMKLDDSGKFRSIGCLHQIPSCPFYRRSLLKLPLLSCSSSLTGFKHRQRYWERVECSPCMERGFLWFLSIMHVTNAIRPRRRSINFYFIAWRSSFCMREKSKHSNGRNGSYAHPHGLKIVLRVFPG
jgi:hypothetical protein